MVHLVFYLIIFSSSCASVNTSGGEVLDKAKELQVAINTINSEKIWDMLVPWYKEDAGPKNEYLEEVSLILRAGQIKSGEPKLVVRGKNWAVTQSDLSVVGTDNAAENDCVRTIWLKLEEKWYFESTFLNCDYMPDAERIDFLTRGLK